MKRILFFLSALMLTSISYAQPMDKQMKKATMSATTVTRGQTLKEKVAITGTIQAQEKVQKQLPENALMLKPIPNRTRTLLDNFLESPAARSLNLGKITPQGKRNLPGMFRYNETVQSVPYSITFDTETQDAFNEFMAIDNNGDGRGWQWNSYYGVHCIYSSSNAADDYFIAPPISMEGGKNYTITVNVQAAGSSFPERFEILVGTEATVAALTTTALAPVETNSTTAEDYEGSFTAPADGTYYVAIHCISDADQWYLRLNQFDVTVGASADAPAAPTVTATGAENGVLTATVEVTAPKNAINGEKLTDNLTKVELYRDGELAYTKENVAPGGKFTYVDENLENGTHKYYAIAYSAEGPGEKSEEVSVYVGVVKPAAPTNFASEDQVSSILFTWDKVTSGASDGYFVPEDVDYNIYTVWNYYGSLYLDSLIATVHDADSYIYETNTDEGDQEYAYWALTASNAGGENGGYVTSMIIGKPYALPVTEGFASNAMHYVWDYYGDLYYLNSSTDGDGYAKALTMDEEGYVYFLSGKLNLKNATNPTLLMDVAGPTTVYFVGIPDNGEMKILGSYTPNDSYFETVTVPLPADIVGERFSQVGFLIQVETPYDGTSDDFDIVYFDNIRIINLPSDDLAIELDAPATVNAGGTATITAYVDNLGANDASNYTVTIKAGDKVLLNETVGDVLSSLDYTSFTANLETSIYDEAADIPIVAEVTYSADEDTENNKDEAQISILVPTLPAPENLVAVVNDANGVDLSWNAPGTEAGEVTEDFEDQSIFPTFGLGGITEENHNGAFGEWTLYDGTGGATVWGFQDAEFANESVPHAWQVLNPEEAGLGTGYYPPSGSQCLLSVCPLTSAGVPSNHWLISPALTGNAQTISFMLRTITDSYGDEDIEVLASSTDTDPESFTLVQDFTTDVVEWTEFTAELPAGTKYFAIRHTSNDIFGILVDDITFKKAASKPAAYNIYFEDELVGTVEGDVTTFTIGSDKVLTGEHNVGVTAVYGADQESAPAQATVTIGGSWLPGDVNHDGQVNITDVTLTVNYVLTGATNNFYWDEANVNGDSEVNITDVTALVNLVLKQVSH